MTVDTQNEARERKIPDYYYRNPATGEVLEARRGVASPYSGIPILVYVEDADGSRRTIRNPEGLCPACVDLVRKKGQTHSLDPIFFWGAGVYDYMSQQTPIGRRCFLNRNAFGAFVKSLPYDVKRSWKKVVGLPFPYLAVKEYEKSQGNKGRRRKRK